MRLSEDQAVASDCKINYLRRPALLGHEQTSTRPDPRYTKWNLDGFVGVMEEDGLSGEGEEG